MATPGTWQYSVPALPTVNYGTNTGSNTWAYNPQPNSAVTTQPQTTPTAIGNPYGGTYAINARTMWANSAANAAATAGTPIADQWARAAGYSPSITGPIYNAWDPTTYTDATKYDAFSKYLSTWYTPQQQLQQNAYQWAQEYDEAMRRYNMEYDLQNQMNQFSMGLQGRQQEMSEWEAQQAAQQWAQQFGWQQTTDEWTRALAQQQANYEEAVAQAQAARTTALTPAEVAQLQAQAAYQQQQTALLPQEYALKARETALSEREQAYLEQYRQQQLQQALELAMLQRQTAIEQANIGAFGRAMRPNARYMRNWG